MDYTTTGTMSMRASLQQAVLRSVAPDGGLYMPADIPRLPRAFFNNISGLSLQEISYVVANMLFGDDIDSGMLQRIVNETLNFDVPLRDYGDDCYGLELFHGPTMGFKDVGARFMARLTSHYGGSRNINVLVATSGDTGGAVATGFYNVPGVNVYVLFPMQKRDRLQQAQFTMPGGNIHTLLVNATVDECRELVRQVFCDSDFVERMSLISANSINVARLLPQTFYYFHAYARLPGETRRRKEVVFSVPCGNLGNLTAGIMAKRMGLPVKRFIAVNNANSAFVDYLDSGTFKRRRNVNTLAPAMDVGDPSNLPRVMWLYGGDHSRLAAEVTGRSFSDDEIAAAMLNLRNEKGVVVDPHSAIAYQALADGLRQGEAGIFLDTAHPAKFGAEVEAVMDEKVAMPHQLRGGVSRRRNVERLAPNVDAIKDYLKSHCK